MNICIGMAGGRGGAKEGVATSFLSRMKKNLTKEVTLELYYPR